MVERRVAGEVNRQSCWPGDFHRRKRGYMNTLRRLRNFWMPWVAMIVLGCFSDAVAQTSYKVVDLGVVNDKDNFSCAMTSIISAGRCPKRVSWIRSRLMPAR